MEFTYVGQEVRRKSNWEHETPEMAGSLGVGVSFAGWPRHVLLPACSAFVCLG